MNEQTNFDLIIIGGGPAGLNAALYASRANLSVAFVEKGTPGGKLSATSKIENWIGTEIIEGWQLAQDFFKHAEKYGAKYLYGNVVEVRNISDTEKEIYLSSGTVLKAKAVLIATGMKNRIPTFIKNIEKFIQRGGVSFCAICDGPLFGKNPTLVLGDGNSAVEESAYLSSIASEVHLVIRGDDFKAERRLVQDLYKLPNVKIYRMSQIVELKGEDRLESAIIKDADGNETEIKVSSFFPYIGMESTAWFLQDLGILNDKGFIITDENMETSVPGIFAAGDIRVKEIRQIVTAASDGAIAAKRIVDLVNTEGND
ncbi:NAD(P)/FAD-dependent oxidoreductase [Mycoplasmopsis verecunda]|uniref:Thioredoxin reductase (NADPH) n=1 Tax=Mycoplasmopsis verecunda TaxID=171291 RepID=A0A1T4KSF8_9BACT|nr:FAD-dependent oxidoreductase [Mycoplasmopsis verecunda]WPB54676.1 FAD-dependent oxidoreductase [Mycoplasmopsis verecunda]SJZ45280.1 thioredoxin reductase (NADPH) [Mycoplasmopsis verecunda]